MHRMELAAHVLLALAAGALGILFSSLLGVPPYSLQMAGIVIATLIPIEFAALIAWDSIKRRKKEAKLGILPSRARLR